MYLSRLSFSVIIFAITVANFINGCQTRSLPTISPLHRQDLSETRLGTSNYYLLIPNNFYISEARSKEGALGYNIIPRDTSSRMFGFVEILRGGSIGDGDDDTDSKLFAVSMLSDKKVQWRITRTSTGYYQAYTSGNGDLNAHATTKMRTDIDTLISIIATLKKK